MATYTYDAAGQKLRNLGTDGSWDYISGIVYHNGAIAFVSTEEGRAERKDDGSYNYEYNLKDHLGNSRVSMDYNPSNNTARVLQEDEYYSFGLRKGLYDLSNNNRYLYNGKEVQTDLANQYDYGARFYDPVIARWTSVDPVAEKGRRWSPYVYGFNDPIRMIDPDGMWPDWGEIINSAVNKAKSAAVNYATNAVKNIVSATKRELKDLASRIEPAVYADGNVTVKATAGGSADVEGLGIKGDVKAKQLLSATVGGDINTKTGKGSNNSELNYANKNGNNVMTTGAGAEFIVGTEYQKTQTVNSDGKVISTTKSASGSVAIQG